MIKDHEIIAMNNALELMTNLNQGQKARIINWLFARFGIAEVVLDNFPATEPTEPIRIAKTRQPKVTEELKPTPASTKPTPTPTDEEEQEEYEEHEEHEEEETQGEDDTEQENKKTRKSSTQPTEPKKERKKRGPRKKTLLLNPDGTKKSFKDFESAGELFEALSAKKGPEKVLLMAAYMKERINLVNFTSAEINTRFKNIGLPLTNIFFQIQSALKKNLMAEAPNQEGKKSKLLTLTDEGFKLAQELLK